MALANAQMNLNMAFRNFFRFIYNKLVLPKLGPIKIKKHRELPNDAVIKSVTVSMTATGKYYASVLLDIDLIIDTVVAKAFIGLDFSMKELFVSSEGESANIQSTIEFQKKN